MSTSNQYVVASYAQGITPEEIAEDTGWELEAVKMALLQDSPLYRERALAGRGDNLALADEAVFSKRDLTMAKNTIKQLCQESEIDSVKFKAAEFIVNEYKGRNDLRMLKNSGFSIVMVSESMSRAREAMHRDKIKSAKRVVELEGVAA